MPLSLDVFNGDAFGVTSLTAAINQPTEAQAAPTLLDALFEEEGVTAPAVFIERDHHSLYLVPAAERGAPGDPTSLGRRDAIPFQTLHLPTPGSISADEVTGLRAFGSESELETLQSRVNKLLAKMRARLDATIRFHRAGAIQGKVYDANGSTVLLDLFSKFGISEQYVDMALGVSGTDVLQKVIDAKRKAEDAIADSGTITGWMCIHGRGFGDSFRAHAEVKDAYKDWRQGDALRTDMRAGFPFGGVMFQEYYGRTGGVDWIGADDAYLIPMGVSDLFITRFAPANWVETAGTMGQPYYARQELMKMGKGIEVEAQSNPLSLCTHPRAVIHLYKTAKPG